MGPSPRAKKVPGAKAEDRQPTSVRDFFPTGNGDAGREKGAFFLDPIAQAKPSPQQVRLYQSDCLVGMSRVGTGSVDLILCDLPYGTTACRWDTVIPFAPLWEQYRRVLKPRGALVLMAAQPFATDLINSARKLFRYDLIWEKNTPVGYANANRMPMRSHELILVFYQRLPKYHPQGLIPLEKPIVRKASPRAKDGVYPPMKGGSVQRYTHYPRSVLRFPNRQERRFHPTQKPVDLMSYLVRTYTDPGDLVMDNCMGSGSVGIACLETGRRFVGFEKDPQYFAVAQERIHSWETGKIEGVSKSDTKRGGKHGKT